MNAFRIILYLISLCFLIITPKVYADTWESPQVETYVSKNGIYKFTVTPRDLASRLAFFSDKVDGKDNAGQASGGNTQSMGVLEKKISDDQWELIWKSELSNDVSPVDAVVSDDGHYVVTFDNWHSVGYGSNVIVVYDESGSIKIEASLNDILPWYYVEALPRSVSSRYWQSGSGRINDTILSLDIIVPNNDLSDSSETFELLLNLKTNRITKANTKDWIKANNKALESAKLILLSIESGIAYHHEPLQYDENNLQPYLRNAFWRIVSADKNSGVVNLKPLSDASYKQSVEWLYDNFEYLAEASKNQDVNEEDELLRSFLDDADSLAVTSLDQENLNDVLIEIANKAKQNEYSAATLLVIIDQKYWIQLQNAFKKSNIKLFLHDPIEPIEKSDAVIDRFFNPSK